MNQTCLVSEEALSNRINDYFTFIEGEYHLENKQGSESKDPPAPAKKIWDRDPEPATFAGLAVYLGFASLQAFDAYLETGKYNEALKSGHLRIEASYERKLHAQSATGAIFALKNRGWNERSDAKQQTEQFPTTLPVEILHTGLIPAQSEKDVIL